MLPMSQVHSPGSNLRQSRSKNSTLPLCENEEMEAKVPGENETRGNSSRDSKASAKGRKAGQGRKRDKNLDHEAVKTYRDIFKLCPSFYWRQAIVLTVENDPKQQAEWKRILAHWKSQKWNPLNIKYMLSEFERLVSFKDWKGNGHG